MFSSDRKSDRKRENENERAVFLAKAKKGEQLLEGRSGKLGKPDKLGKQSTSALQESTQEYDIACPQDILLDQKFIESFCSAAHKAGLSQEQLDALSHELFDHIRQCTAQQLEQEKELVQNTREALKNEWGQDFEHNMRCARLVTQHFRDDKLLETLEQGGMANRLNIIQVLSKIGRLLQEDDACRRDNIAHMSSAQARSERDKLQSDKIFLEAYLDAQHPEHKSALLRMKKINRHIIKREENNNGTY